MENESLGYFLSLCDEAERVLLADPLCERVKVQEYQVKEMEVKAPAKEAFTGKLSSRSEIRDALLSCHSCDLWMNRPEIMHASVGSMHPKLLFVVDKILPDGSFFTPQDMAYFKKWLEALGLKTLESAITSVIKCPGGGFNIEEDCLKLLKLQVNAMKPGAVVFLGEAGSLIAADEGDIAIARKKNLSYEGVPCQVTYSPEMVLKDRSLRRPVWEDLQRAYGFGGWV